MKKVYLLMVNQWVDWDDGVDTDVEACYDSEEEVIKAIEYLSKTPDPEHVETEYYYQEMEVKNKFIPFSENEDSAE